MKSLRGFSFSFNTLHFTRHSRPQSQSFLLVGVGSEYEGCMDYVFAK